MRAQHGEPEARVRSRPHQPCSGCASSAGATPTSSGACSRRPSTSSARPEGGTFFLLGTDRLGRDVLSRIIYGARISLTIGLLGVSVSFVLGIVIGGLAGYYGGLFDLVIQRVIEVHAVAAAASRSGWRWPRSCRSTWSPLLVYFGITIILGLMDWTGLARSVRSKLLCAARGGLCRRPPS